MNTPTFLAWSLAAAGFITLSIFTIGHFVGAMPAFVPTTREVRGQRLQRRLDKRLAHGTDHYFEELRSIETAIAANAKMPAQPTLLARAFPIPFAAMAVLYLGAIAVKYAAPPLLGAQPPGWSHEIGMAGMLLVGLQIVISPADNNVEARGAARLFGFIILVLGACALFIDLHSSTQGT